jgi:hypothetical protein
MTTRTNDDLYPTSEDYVHNPLLDNLDGAGKKIVDVDTFGLTGTGAITGVVTINGVPYPPTLPNGKNYTWLYSSVAAQNIYSGYGVQQNSMSWETAAYNSPINPITLQSYTWPSGTVLSSAFVVPLTGVYRVTVNIAGIMNSVGSFSMGLCVGGFFAGGGNLVWTQSTANAPVGLYYYPQPINPYSVTILTLTKGQQLVVAGLDADAAGDSIAVGGTLAGGNVNVISTFQIEYLG